MIRHVALEVTRLRDRASPVTAGITHSADSQESSRGRSQSLTSDIHRTTTPIDLLQRAGYPNLFAHSKEKLDLNGP